MHPLPPDLSRDVIVIDFRATVPLLLLASSAAWCQPPDSTPSDADDLQAGRPAATADPDSGQDDARSASTEAPPSGETDAAQDDAPAAPEGASAASASVDSVEGDTAALPADAAPVPDWILGHWCFPHQLMLPPGLSSLVMEVNADHSLVAHGQNQHEHRLRWSVQGVWRHGDADIVLIWVTDGVEHSHISTSWFERHPTWRAATGSLASC